MNTPDERLNRTAFSLPLRQVYALVGGAVNARSLLSLAHLSFGPKQLLRELAGVEWPPKVDRWSFAETNIAHRFAASCELAFAIGS